MNTTDLPSDYPLNYPYGHRRITTYDQTGQPHFTYSALQQEDFLNPQEDDHFAHGENHARDIAELYRALQNHHRYHPQFTVYRSLKMLWGIDGLEQPAPDLAIVKNISDPERPRNIFDVNQEKVRPCTIIEVTSPLFAEQDLVDKVRIYAQAGIEEYFVIVSAPSNAKTGVKNDLIVAYRLVEGVYQSLEADEKGRFYSRANDFWVVPKLEGDGVFLVDGKSGMRIEAVDVAGEKMVAEVQGNRRGNEILSALGFLTEGEFDARNLSRD